MAIISVVQDDSSHRIIVDSLIASRNRIRISSHDDISVNGGEALCALLSYCLFLQTGEYKWMENARSHLISGLSLLNNISLNNSLYRSAPGYGWVVSKLWRKVQWEEGELVVDEISSAYLQFLSKRHSLGMDLIDGLAGLAVFSREAGANYRNLLLDSLWDTVCDTLPVMSLHDRDVGNDQSMSETFKDLDMGLAHGIPGVIATFAAAIHFGWENEEAKSVLRKLGWWMERHRTLSDNKQIGFPYSTHSIRSARLGWCYGLPSAAIAFAWLSSLYHEFRDPLAQFCLNSVDLRGSEYHGMDDYCICHGFVGWAYVGNRLAEVMNRHSVASMVRYSAMSDYSRTINYLRGLADPGALPHMIDNKCMVFDTLLEGSAGASLALAGLQDAECRVWEGLLLLDFPLFDD